LSDKVSCPSLLAAEARALLGLIKQAAAFAPVGSGPAQGAPPPGPKLARLSYRLLASGEHYHLLEIELHTGRHHQIRCQLAALGCPIKGDLKYGAPRSNPGGSISLLSRQISFTHPVSKEALTLTAPVPDERLWHDLEAAIEQ